MLRAQIAQRLVNIGARNVTNADNRIRFSGKLSVWSFDLSKWNIYFRLISRGAVTVDCRDNGLHVAYQISLVDVRYPGLRATTKEAREAVNAAKEVRRFMRLKLGLRP